jgi:3-isopropylmalate dehydrogenase
MYLINRPSDFDVIVTENMFGDILTDEVSMLSGSLGMLPSASLSDNKVGLYEPIHGSAPDIAGKGIANPCGMISSIAMLLRYSLNLVEEAIDVENAIYNVIENGARTADIATTDDKISSTEQITKLIIDEIN